MELRIETLLPRYGCRCIAVLHGYFDESGTHRNAALRCVAGYFAPRSRWAAFERDWRAVLSEYDASDFHAKTTKSEVLKPHLLRIIKHHKLRGVVCSVSPAAYDVHASIRFKSKIGNAYAACAFACALEVCRQARQLYGDHVSLFFEAGQPNMNHIDRVVKTMIGVPIDPSYSQIASVTFAPKDVLPLHAADFLAHSWSTNSSWLEKLEGASMLTCALLTPDRLENISEQVEYLMSKRATATEE
jgi:hypothetical protein